jgi:hypothetical protein
MTGRVSELTGQQQNELHAAATRAGQRVVIDLALDGSLLFTVSPGPGEKVFDNVVETIQAFEDLAEVRRSPC